MPGPLIQPFEGLLYNPAKIGDIAQCVCPPYDVITDPGVYYRRNPYNAIRLELPQAVPPDTPYDAAARTLEEWLRASVLVRDFSPTVYLYEQEFQVGGQRLMRRGFVGAVRLDGNRILTHEETRAGAKKDREMLTRRLDTFTSLIFGLFQDPSGEVDALLTGAERKLLYDFTDELSVRNRFSRLEARPDMDRLAELMDEKNIYVADGHHRLSVALKLGLPHVAIYLTEMHSTGIVVLPYHRIVSLRARRTTGELLARVAGYLDVSTEPLPKDDPSATLTARIAASESSCYVLLAGDEPGRAYVLTPKKALLDGSMAPSLKRLRVNIAHEGILKRILGVEEEEISFAKDAGEAVSAVREGRADLALLVPPTTVDEVREIAENHLFMPPKSTYFYPKILTGLVFHKYA